MTSNKRIGVASIGIKTPIIKPGDDLARIVVSSVVNAVGSDNIRDGDIIGVTEAVVAIAQGNFVTSKEIVADIMRKFPGVKELAIVDPIQSRNRFMGILYALAAVPQLDKLHIVMTYPTDEVGNRLVSEEAIMDSGVNPYGDILSLEEFYSKLGIPKHPFTSLNYPKAYEVACGGKAEIIFCNNFSKIPEICENSLVCSIHRRGFSKKMLQKNGGECVLDLSEIMNEPVNGSKYNEKFGLYGTNLMAAGKLKLMPRNCQEFTRKIQCIIKSEYGKEVEVFVYGDGAFKDPVGGIWELADPETTLGATEGLKGTPKEVKLKYLASANANKSPEEIEKIVAEEKAKRMASEDIAEEFSLGTTPRRITDLVASLADLTTGSGDRQTPVVYIKGYLNK